MSPLRQTPEIRRLLQKICKHPPPLIWQVEHLWRKVGLLDNSHTDKLLLYPYASQEARLCEDWPSIVTELGELGVSASALMSALVGLKPSQLADIDLLRQFNNAALKCLEEESRKWKALKRLSRSGLYDICGPSQRLSKHATQAIVRLNQDRRALKEVERILSECEAAIGEAKGRLFPQISLEVVHIINQRMNDWALSLVWAYKLVCAWDPDRTYENFAAFEKGVGMAQRRVLSREGESAPRRPKRRANERDRRLFTCLNCRSSGMAVTAIPLHLMVCNAIPLRMVVFLNDSGEFRHFLTGKLLATAAVGTSTH